ncbi:MAG: hypothetical protein ABIP93_04780 [Gemmatimonadaceae bacterium]
MSPLERLVGFVIAQYRWGLHPLKLLVALLLPIVLLWAADWHVRRRSASLAAHEPARRKLPRTRRR